MLGDKILAAGQVFAQQDVKHPGGGLGIGYTLPFKKNPRWGVEFAIGAGVYDVKYDVFYNEVNGPYAEHGVHDTFFGIDNASIAFTYKFDMKRKEGRR